MADVKGIPKTERIWVRHIRNNGDVFYTTSKENDTSMFFLYQFDKQEGKAVKLGKSKSPLELEKKYIKD